MRPERLRNPRSSKRAVRHPRRPSPSPTRCLAHPHNGATRLVPRVTASLTQRLCPPFLLTAHLFTPHLPPLKIFTFLTTLRPMFPSRTSILLPDPTLPIPHLPPLPHVRPPFPPLNPPQNRVGRGRGPSPAHPHSSASALLSKIPRR